MSGAHMDKASVKQIWQIWLSSVIMPNPGKRVHFLQQRAGMWVNDGLIDVVGNGGKNIIAGIMFVHLRDVAIGVAQRDISRSETPGSHRCTAANLIIMGGIRLQRAGIIVTV